MMARFYKLLEENVEHNMVGRLPVLQLTIQYRMHPDICLFPSNYIYNRSLKTNRWVLPCSSMRKALLITANVGEQKKGGTAHICTTQIMIGIMWECVLPALVLRVSLFTSFFN